MKAQASTYLLALTVAWGLLACDMGDQEAGNTPLMAYCSTNGNCPGNLVCDQKVNVCVSTEFVQVNAWLRLLPPQKGVLAVEEQYASVEVTNTQDVKLTLHPPVRVVGRVQFEGNPLAIQDAQIIAVAAGTIPDLNFHQDAKATTGYTYDYDKGETDKPGFEFWVAEDKTYDVYVYLSNLTDEGTEYPPYHERRNFALRDAVEGTYDWNIEVPLPHSYIHLTGCILSAGEELTPIVGAKVLAYSDQSGNSSSVGLTDSDGCYDIAIQPLEELTPDVYELRLKPSSENELVPDVVLDSVEVNQAMLAETSVEGDEDGEAGKSIHLGDMVVHDLDRLAIVKVVVSARDETETPSQIPEDNAQEIAASLAHDRVVELTKEVLGTQVKFAGKVDEGMLRMERTITEVETDVDEDGGIVRVEATIVMQLPPRSYVLSLIPRADSRYGIYQELYIFDPVDSEPAPIEVELKKKATTTIHVTAPDGNSVAGALVSAVLSGKGNYPETAPVPIRLYEAAESTLEPGYYVMSLDPGTYTIVVDAPQETGLPRHIERDCYVHGSSQQRPIQLSEPSAITGIVYGTLTPEATTGEEAADATEESQVGPVAGVKVEMFDETEGSSEADGISPIPTATGWSDEDGRFVLIVPVQ